VAKLDGHEHHDHRRSHQYWRVLRAMLLGLLKPHDHAEKVDPALETSTAGIRALKVSFVGLGITAALQMVVVAVSGSVALLSDTIHNFGDALTAVPLWIAFALSRKPRNQRYTHGYGRAEDLAGVFIIVAIGVSAAVAGYEALQRLGDPDPVRYLPIVFAASLIGFAGNELVAVYRIRVGRAIGSAALVADGLHARTDGLTSLAVFAGALGVALGFQRADALAGLLIAVAILVILRSAAQGVFHRLMDAVSPNVVEQIETVLRAIEGVEHADDVRVRWIGHRLRAEIEMTVNHSLTIVEGHDVAVSAHHALLHEIPNLAEAIVHANPSSMPGRDHHAKLVHHLDA
jgi:cation diffusion facilitator family transporter